MCFFLILNINNQFIVMLQHLFYIQTQFDAVWLYSYSENHIYGKILSNFWKYYVLSYSIFLVTPLIQNQIKTVKSEFPNLIAITHDRKEIIIKFFHENFTYLILS